MALIIFKNLNKFGSKIKTIEKRSCIRRWCSDPNQKSEENSKTTNIPIPPEPTSCCMTACPNCVWIKYAQNLAQTFDDGDVIAKNKITEKVTDPSMRAFLLMQLGLNESKN